MFVVERRGVIRILRNGSLNALPFLDLGTEISTFGYERGMLGLAFHPRYAENRRFFVTFTGVDGRIHLEEFRASAADPDLADVSQRKVLLDIFTPGVQHFGGMMQFTPDGKLLVSIGEGGRTDEVGGEAQNPASLLGKLLRLDVDAGNPYAIPADNPFVGRDGWRPEIWALGLRNPWRFSIDAATRRLYLADVGDDLTEEINIVSLDTRGLNFGWNYYEGTSCRYEDALCEGTYHAPQVEYAHLPPCSSVTGGHVYRGTQSPGLRGHYFYADYCQGWIRSLRYENGRVQDETQWQIPIETEQIASFGEDGRGELYAVSLAGKVYKLALAR
jgi:glucose/arabinose dehydrogenase